MGSGAQGCDLGWSKRRGQGCNWDSWGPGWRRLSERMCGAMGRENPTRLASKGWAEAQGLQEAQRHLGQDREGGGDY